MCILLIPSSKLFDNVELKMSYLLALTNSAADLKDPGGSAACTCFGIPLLHEQSLYLHMFDFRSKYTLSYSYLSHGVVLMMIVDHCQADLGNIRVEQQNWAPVRATSHQ